MYVFGFRVLHIFTLQKWYHSMIDSQHALELSTKSFRSFFCSCSSGPTLHKSAIKGLENKADSEGLKGADFT